jgi:hypothetical protein
MRVSPKTLGEVVSLYTPNEYQMTPTLCHICHGEVREDQHGIEHSGHGQMSQSTNPIFREAFPNGWVDGFTTVWFHPECAAVMALRLSYDVMRMKNVKDQPSRVVDGLQDLAKVNQVR